MFQEVGGPGIGPFPQTTDIPCMWSGSSASDPILPGQVAVMDLPSGTAGSVGGQIPGPDDSGFARMKTCPSNLREPRIGIFGVAMERIEHEKVGMFRFRGAMGLAKGGQADETNPGTGFFVLAATGNIPRGVGMGVQRGNIGRYLVPDITFLTASNEKYFKCLAINMIAQTAPTTAQRSGGWFNGVEGFGVCTDN